MKQAVLLELSMIVEVEEAELALDFGELDRLSGRLEDTLKLVAPCAWQSTRRILLDPAQVNCGKCSVCGAWVTDCERPGRLHGLCIGAVHDGQLLCDEHLPRDHRWAF